MTICLHEPKTAAEGHQQHHQFDGQMEDVGSAGVCGVCGVRVLCFQRWRFGAGGDVLA